ncbi:hypothetical protein HJG45_21955 [Roseicella sp. DB1501]|nr:hypothetical protein [Roseicella sp. DB1501]
MFLSDLDSGDRVHYACSEHRPERGVDRSNMGMTLEEKKREFNAHSMRQPTLVG